MDYSTISNKTANETEDVPEEELSERYHTLKKVFDNLYSTYETTKQELHDAKRSYQTALDVQRHLNAELEGYQAEEESRRRELNVRVSTLLEEISVLREERTEAAELHANEIKKFETEIKRLKEEQQDHVEKESPEQDNSELEEVRQTAAKALSDAETAKEALEQARFEIASWKMKTEEFVNELAEMRATADLHREELKAAAEREAVALAELAETKAILNQYTNSQDLQSHAAKGNSIFAEVEDKRQEMAKTLLQIKQTNARLRRELANKQSELDTLLHEKQTIWEQQAGAAAHYDRELIEAYEERITQLEGTCERQRRELARWFHKHTEPNAHGWLPAVLDHFKSECSQLRSEALSGGAAQLASAAQVRDLRRKLAQLTAEVNTPRDIEPTQPIDKDEIPVPKPVPTKTRPTEDVRKKVCFN